jgi:hypothetical protein
MVSKADFKNLFQSSLKDMQTKREKQTKKKENMEVNDESLNMNVFEKLMEGKHKESVRNDDGDSKRINSSNTFSHSEQNNMTEKSCLGNYYNYNYDEMAYPFSKRIKVKHEPEAAQENKAVRYTADVIVEIKNRDGAVVPMIVLLDTGTTTIIILKDFVGKGRARANTKKRTKWKTPGGTFTTNYESLLDFKFPELSTSKVVTWQAHVDDKTSSQEAAYDIPLKTRNTLSDDEILHMLYNAANEPDILQEAEKRQNRILDVD